jgi:hypothetical protein
LENSAAPCLIADKNEVDILKPGEPSKRLSFDFVFDPQSAQENIFQSIVQDFVHPFLQGYNVTIFA